MAVELILAPDERRRFQIAVVLEISQAQMLALHVGIRRLFQVRGFFML